MVSILKFLPFVSTVLALVFAVMVLRRFAVRHGTHLLLWGIGLVFFAVGSFCEGYYAAVGWSPLVFRLWYLLGAVLVAAWLGQGTIYLLAPRRWAHALMILLGAGSLYAAWRVFGAQLDPSVMGGGLHTGSELSGNAIVSPGVRSLTPFFNGYGTLALVGGAVWSFVRFLRRPELANRAVGNLLIAVGAILPAFGGTSSRFGIPAALYIGELAGVVLLFIGFLRAITPAKGVRQESAPGK